LTQTTEADRLLIEAVQADPARFVEIYDGYVDRIYAYVSRRVGNRADAEDITSQVFEQALGAIPRLEWRGVPLSAWLFKIASNALTDHWREHIRRSEGAQRKCRTRGSSTISSGGWCCIDTSSGCRNCSGR